MKHRTHQDFPTYRFYKDGRILNKKTHRFIKVKPHMKLISAQNRRRSITTQKYFALLFPDTYTWRDHRMGKHSSSKPPYKPLRNGDFQKGGYPKKYDDEFVKKVQEEAKHETWNNLVKKYNIPMGSLGHILRKGKLPPGKDISIVININRVIIRK